MKALKATAALTALVLLAGCTSSGGEEGQLREVSIGLLPAAATAAIYVGIEEGFFEREGIELRIESGQGSAALLPAVSSGQMQFASGTPVSLLIARDQGLDVRVVSPWTGDGVSGNGTVNSSNVVIANDPAISTAVDLEGKTVAINALHSVGDLTIREAVRHAGGDPGAVTFVEMTFADMPGALAQGHVDAIWTAEPFISTLLDEGNHAVTGTNNSDAIPNMITQVIFTSQQLADEDPELVAAMARALKKTLQFSAEHPEDVRAKVPTVLPQIDQDLLAQLIFDGYYETGIDRAPLERIAQLLDGEAWLRNPADVDGLLQSLPADRTGEAK
ncbi:hypothetical protein BAY59_27140 [Prauserella coralliicola]|nr:hypothetical protein BAY59_27140 [Prauserella coralliicola]